MYKYTFKIDCQYDSYSDDVDEDERQELFDDLVDELYKVYDKHIIEAKGLPVEDVQIRANTVNNSIEICLDFAEKLDNNQLTNLIKITNNIIIEDPKYTDEYDTIAWEGLDGVNDFNISIA